MPRNILCFGDSNVWGSIASWVPTTQPSSRYDEHTRWPRAAADILGDGYRVIEEGLSGRNTIYHDPDAPYKSGEAYLLPCLLSHRPLDLVILMLGTNDLKLTILPEESHFGDGISRLVDIVQQCQACGDGQNPPGVLVVSPIHAMRPQGRQDYFEARGGDVSVTRVRKFAAIYEAVAREKGCWFLDAAKYAEPDPGDGLHMTREAHIALGRIVAEKVREIFTGDAR